MRPGNGAEVRVGHMHAGNTREALIGAPVGTGPGVTRSADERASDGLAADSRGPASARRGRLPASARRPRALPAPDVRRDGPVPRRAVQPSSLGPAGVVIVLVADAGQPVRGSPLGRAYGLPRRG